MKRFKFRLESIEKLRDRAVRMRQVERANAQGQLVSEEKMLERLIEEKERFLTAMQKERDKTTFLLPTQLQQLSSNIMILDQKIREQADNVEQHKKILKEVVTKLIEEEKERKVLVELRQQEFANYRDKQKRKDRDQADFISEQLFRRKRNRIEE